VSPLAPGAHPSPEEVDVLLDLPGGQSPDDVGQRSVATHVAGCPACQDIAASLRAVRDLLREEGRRTPPVPDDLPGRLDAALARASAERDGTVVPIGAVRASRDAVTEGRQVPRWVGVAAGLAVLGGAALAATQVLDVGGADSGTFTSAESSGGGGEADRGAAAGAALSTGTEYTRAQLPAQVDALLTGAPEARTLSGQGLSPSRGEDAEAAPDDPASATLPDADEPLADPAGLQGCLEAIGAPGVEPLAVDLATFEGEDAAVLVLPGSSPDQVEVWVVARDCRPGADGLQEFQRVTVD